MKRTLLAPVAAALLLIACTHKATPVAGGGSTQADCRTVMCTMDFRTISLRVVDAAGKPVELDNFKTLLASEGTQILQDAAGADGVYMVVHDDWVRDHKNTTTKMTFIGLIGNKTVVTEPFEIKTDCCHISKISGKETVLVQ